MRSLSEDSSPYYLTWEGVRETKGSLTKCNITVILQKILYIFPLVGDTRGMKTLCQYYDSYAKRQGYHTWNHLCAKLKQPHRTHLKKSLKKEYKLLKAEEINKGVQPPNIGD